MSQTYEKPWRTVQLPKQLVDEVERRVSKKNSGYTGIGDYITYVLRKNLEGEN